MSVTILIRRIAAVILPVLVALPLQAAVVTVFNETFGTYAGTNLCNPAFPAGWTRYDVDGKTPHINMSFVNNAWIVREDFNDNVSNCAAFSTSWYEPPGPSDDWLVTPAIAVPSAGPELRFNAKCYDASFPDGYEVRWATTNTVAAFLANPPLLAVAAETRAWNARKISLASLAGQTVYFAFRNNSNDKFLLLVDDVQVVSVPDYQGSIESVLRPHASLLRLPVGQAIPLQLGATIHNYGQKTLTNAVVTAHVKVDGNEVHTVSAAAVATLAADASATVTMTPYTVTQTGTVTVEYTLATTETDAYPADNAMTSAAALVTSFELGRDDGVLVERIGIGSDGGQFGSVFHVSQSAYVRAIRFYTQGYNADLAGDAVKGEIRSTTGTPAAPDALLAETLSYVVPNPPVAAWVDLTVEPPLLLSPGDYYFGLVEAPPDAGQNDALDVGMATTIFTAEQQWVRFPPAQPNWTVLDTYGMQWQRALMLRVLFTNVADLSAAKTASPSPAPAGGVLTYTIDVANGGPDPATDVVVTDPLPAGTTFASASGTGWTCAHAAGAVTCTRPSLAAGAAPSITIGVTAPSAITSLSNTATVTAWSADPDGPATATAVTSVISPASIALTKSVNGSTSPGGTVTYTIVLTNAAATAQQNNPGAELTDVLPASLQLVSASATNGAAVATVATNTVTWDGVVPGNGSVTITVTATISAAAANGQVVSNQAIASSDADGDGNNETSTASQPASFTVAPAGAVVSPVSVTVAEGGASATFDVNLTAPPTADVIVSIANPRPGEVSVDLTSLTFTTANWATPQTVTVGAVDDLLLDGPQSVTLALTAASGDAAYASLDPSDVAVNTTDDEVDSDSDGVVDDADNCPLTANPAQEDLDGDGLGDVCDSDRDGDGVSDATENAAPNGGDGNADGIADSAQPRVASLPAATGDPVTLVATCELENVAARATGSMPVSDPYWTYPFGLLEFRLPCPAATVDLYFHTAANWPRTPSYRKYGPVAPGVPSTSAWYTLHDAIFDVAALGSAPVAHARITLADGALGDDTAIDGVIVDQGGPGFPGPAVPLASPAVLLFLALVLGACGMFVLRFR